MPFLELPNELIERTLMELHPMESCRVLRSLIDNSIELQLRVELAADGFLLGYRGNLPAYELLEMVLQRRRACENFLPQSFWEIECLTTNRRTFETYDGVFGCSQLAGPNGGFQGVAFQELAPPGSPKGRWSLEMDRIGIDAHDFSFWLDADAMFLVERRNDTDAWRIHFRHLSYNEPHRLAFEPFIDFLKLENRVIWDDCMVMVWEERISIEFFDFGGAYESRRMAAVIIDWTTGRILLPYTVVSDVAFLTKDLIIRRVEPCPEDVVITFKVQSLSDSAVDFRCEFPISWQFYSTQFQKHPISNHGADCPTRHAKMFLPDPSLSILPIVFKPVGGLGLKEFTIVLSVRAFLRKCTALAATTANSIPNGPSAVVPVLKWDEWGPDVARWLPPEIHGGYGSRMVSGPRMLALLRKDDEQGGTSHNILLDFNPRALHRRLPTDVSDEFGMMIVDGETESSQFSVKSRLAYRAWTSNLEYRYRNVSLEANTIIGRLENGFHFFSFLLPSAGSDTPPRIL